MKKIKRKSSKAATILADLAQLVVDALLLHVILVVLFSSTEVIPLIVGLILKNMMTQLLNVGISSLETSVIEVSNETAAQIQIVVSGFAQILNVASLHDFAHGGDNQLNLAGRVQGDRVH